MSKNWAIVIGINDYNNLASLKYAKYDAETIQDFLLTKLGFEKVFLFTDDSPDIKATPKPIKTEPTYGNLKRFFRVQFEEKLLEEGDTLWFFFAGHGMQISNCDYLMLSDSDPGGAEETAISINYIVERLRLWGSDNVILFLDACRDVSGRGVGFEEHQGIITFYSCSSREKSYEIDDLRHGSFTYALLEGLRLLEQGKCTIVEQMSKYLQNRVTELNNQYEKGRQTSYVDAKPIAKLYMLLLPKYATETDILRLKNFAYKCETEGNNELAKQLWVQISVACFGDNEAIKAIVRISKKETDTFEDNKHENLTIIQKPQLSNNKRNIVWTGLIISFGLLFFGLFLFQRNPFSFSPSISTQNSGETTSKTINIDGSVSMVRITKSLQDNFNKKHQIQIITNNKPSGSERGINNLKSGFINIAAVSRPLTDEEKREGLVEIPVKLDEIAIVVGKDNPITNLSRKEVKNIFQGRVTNWSQLNTQSQNKVIKVINRANDSGTREVFKEQFLNGEEFGSTFNIQTWPDDETIPILQQLRTDGITYATYAHIEAQKTVKSLRIDGSIPTDANYPYKRQFSYVYRDKDNDKPEVKLFIQYINSPEGRKIIETTK